MLSMRARRHALAAGVMFTLVILLYIREGAPARARWLAEEGNNENDLPPVQYLPEPTWTPPLVKDPYPELETTAPPPIPSWNKPKPDIHKQYGIDYAPPLFIGFTRSWPILLQAVISYITAGWPPEQIYVVENTGVQNANAKGKLTLQNPFYLNHKQLKRLGVNVVQAPVLMSFSQLQNFFTHLAQVNNWPYYFWSHMDVLVLSFEDGMEGVNPKATEDGYKTVYELCLTELNRTLHDENNKRWADVFFAYDQLTLVNREAYEEVGGWDTFIPYYMNDCDMHSRLRMHNWTLRDARSANILDVSTVFDDLRALYRDPTVTPSFTDPNPPPPTTEDKKEVRQEKRSADSSGLSVFRKLQDVASSMTHYKPGARGRNTWQLGQRGGKDEPYYYPARGIAEAMEVMTDAGREVFRRKWGHRDCELLTKTRLKSEDQWLVAKDWEE